MKALIIAFFASLLLFGCGSSDLDDPKTLDDIIAKAIDEDKLQERGKVGEELCYIPNAQTPYSGWAKSIYENGQVKQLRQLKDGKPEGLQTLWYQNGQKKEEANFKDGKLDGLVTWWYQNGQKSQEQNWKDDKKNGLEIEWDQNGQKEEEENWKDGKKDGLSTEWYDNGQKASEVIFKDDKAVSATMWKPNGEKCPITNFVGGNGVVVEYNEKSGAVRRRWTFKNGEPVVD